MKKEIAEYEKYVNRIIFFEPTPKLETYAFKHPGDIARKLESGNPISSLDAFALPRESVEKNSYFSWTRIQAAVSDCKKCIVIPTLDLLCDKKKCPVVNSSGLSRYCDRYHLSEVGSDLILPVFKDAVKDLL